MQVASPCTNTRMPVKAMDARYTHNWLQMSESNMCGCHTAADWHTDLRTDMSGHDVSREQLPVQQSESPEVGSRSAPASLHHAAAASVLVKDIYLCADADREP